MKRLLELKIWLPLAVIGISAAFVGYRISASAPPAPHRYEIPERFQQELIELDKRALSEVYINHVDKLWGNYVTQVSHLGHETSRINIGLDHLHQAWVIAKEEIEAREKALKGKCVGC